MVNEATPKERLKKYKENLAKMALLEGRQLDFVNPIRGEKEQETPIKDAALIKQNQISSDNIRPPQVLISPSKRELKESMITPRKKGEDFRTTLEGKKGRDRVMMKAREKAIDGSLQEIKNKKSMLELQLKKKMISKDEYDRRLRRLVEEGQRLLREKAAIDKDLAK